MNVYEFRRNAFSGLLAGVFLLLAACSKPPAPPPPPPATVTVARPIVRDATEWDEYTGTLVAVDSVEIRARVSGEIITADFPEGTVIEKGKLLFQIDPRPYKNALASSKGLVTQAEAKLQLARDDLARAEKVRVSGVISAEEYDTRRQNVENAKGVLASAQAQEQQDALNLEWTDITAPVAGRVSKKLVTKGNLVTSTSTLLTTVRSIDPIYCYVDADENTIQKYQRLAAANKRISARNQPIPCYLRLSDESAWRVGVVDFVDNQFNPNTATIQARGVFSNPGARLQPGGFALLSVNGQTYRNAILVADDAITAEEDTFFVLIVGEGNKVEQRLVKRGALIGNLRVIEEGVKATDWIVINGKQKARPRTVVNPMQKEMPDVPDDRRPPIAAADIEPATAPTTSAVPATSTAPTTGPATSSAPTTSTTPAPSTAPATSTSPATSDAPPSTIPISAPPFTPSLRPVQGKGGE